MTDLHLVTSPARYRHLPTEIEAMRFIASTRQSVHAWLNELVGPERFQMTDTHLMVETTQGDSRFIELGGWVVKRPTRASYEVYVVEHEVIADSYQQVTE